MFKENKIEIMYRIILSQNDQIRSRLSKLESQLSKESSAD